jgi:hypothetical protein
MLQWLTPVVNSCNAGPFPVAACETAPGVNFSQSRPAIVQRQEKTTARKVSPIHNALRRTQKMTTSKILKSLLIAALLASAAANAADQSSIQVAMEDGKTVAQFKIGDSECKLVDGQIRCTWNNQ